MTTNPNSDVQDDIISAIRDIMSKGEEVDLFDLAITLDLDNSMSKVRNFVINGQIASKADWFKAVKVSQTVRELGFYPKTATELVENWIKTNNISVNYQRVMSRQTKPVVFGMPVTEEERKDRKIDGLASISQNVFINTETLKRELRLKVSELALRFNGQEIDDAVEQWFDTALSLRVQEVYVGIVGDEGSSSKRHNDAWDAVVKQFDTKDHDAEFIIAVLKKFIWQVKRKMLNRSDLPISNHLMPVLTGAQGVGKSTFVRKMLKPVEELVSDSDFRSIEEVRNTEQWRNYVLFLDEMGYAGKADIDNVKNKITAPTVTGRPMRSNSNVQFPQNATFIGCSNKELDQLIRDETGNRRFVSLRYSLTPDWEALKQLDPYALWTSVDVYGDDPTLAITAKLREAQAEVREKSMVEHWLEEYQVPSMMHGKARAATALHPDFKSWATEFYGNRVPDVAYFGRELKRLIEVGLANGWTCRSLNGRRVYQFN